MSIVSNRRALTVLIAVGVLVAAVVVVQQADAQSLYACVKKNGSARIFSKKPRCKKRETKLSWNIEGIPGKNGLNGSSGINGANGKGGTSGKEGKPGANGAVAGFSASNITPKAFTGEAEVVIVSKEIPAGSYLAFAKTVVGVSANAQTGASAACELFDTAAGPLDTTEWAGALAELLPGKFVASTSVSLEGAFTAKTSSTLLLECTDHSTHLNKLVIAAASSRIVAVQTTTNG